MPQFIAAVAAAAMNCGIHLRQHSLAKDIEPDFAGK
jgi:hypothetical protein